VFSVPSGNFGNLTAGVLAKKMGLPVHRFIASTNVNDVVPKYLHTKQFTPRASQQTISNAMDVGNPSNFARLMNVFENNWDAITKDMIGYAFTDVETHEAMRTVFEKTRYLLDPHGAVGYLGLKKYMQSEKDVTGVFLETAHPSKFPEVVEQSIVRRIEIAPALLQLLNKPVFCEDCSHDFKSFKNCLLK
jgi:threonine synthase